jgi:hypothetical protein
MAPPRRRKQDVAPRAPRRTGTRTTLRVPDDLAETVARYAEEHRTSTNDALVRLAYAGAKRYEHDREVAEVARRRREAIRRPTEVPPDVEPASAEEVTNAILAWRLGLVDEEEWGA